MNGEILAELIGVGKKFPGVTALEGVNFSLRAGEIRALMGENGAGKSTLIKVLTGVYAPDSGSLKIAGRPAAPRSPTEAQALGVSTVYQELNLPPNLSVAESISLGDEARTFGLIRRRDMEERARRVLARLGVEVDVRRPVGELSAAHQQLTAIARALDRRAKLLILDEPTSSLDQREARELLALLKRLGREGLGIILVTHFLDQVYEAADSITVMRNGQKVGDWAIQDLPKPALVSQMLGRDLEESSDRRASQGQKAPVSFAVEGLALSGVMEEVSFSVGQGETVGLCGLLGSGRTETLQMIFGARPADRGRITQDGSSFRVKSPRQAVRRGMGFCPEDRRAEGIFPGLSVRQNILIILQAKRGILRLLSPAAVREAVDRSIAELRIKVSDPSQPIEGLSGGNQQKAILARWLSADPKLMLLDEPTRGIDIGSKEEIRRKISELNQSGMSIVASSSELEEVVAMSHRVVVLRDRRQAGEVSGEGLNEPALMALIAEGKS